MKPKKELINKAIQDGTIDRMNRLMSAAHLLNCEANNLIDETSDLLREKGLLLGSLKKIHNDFVKCADKYFKEFASAITAESCKMDMFSDLEGFDKAYRKWAKIEDNNNNLNKGAYE